MAASVRTPSLFRWRWNSSTILTQISSQTSTTTTTKSHTFTVPDSDNDNEDDIVSVHSREPSVQILESNIRTATYSVPSESDYGSDPDDYEVDDDDLVTSSVQLSNSKDSAVTTPEQRVVHTFDETNSGNSMGKTLDLNLKGPKLHEVIAKAAFEGSSQHNPIDLVDKNPSNEQPTGFSGDDQSVPRKDVDIDETESEDEGPDVLPIQSTIKRSHIADLLNENPATFPKTSGGNMFNSRARAPIIEEGSQIERIIRETQRRVARDGASSTDGMAPLNVHVSSIAGTTGAVAGSDIDDEDDDDDDYRDDFDKYDMNDAFPPDFNEANEFDGPALFDFPAEKPKDPPAFSHRAPSPSDAALARASSNLASVPQRSAEYTTGFPNSTINPRFSRLLSQPSNTAPPATDYSLWRDVPMPSSRYNTGSLSGHAQGSYQSTHHGHYDDILANQIFGTAELRLPETPTTRAIDDPSSKLHISNLVNSYHAEPPWLNKRKAAEISVDAEDLDIGTARSRPSATSQESPLSDAQPRDALIPTENSISLGETTLPTVNSIPSEVVTKTSTIEEPSSKRAKTSSSSSGIGKFLIGVGVGAIGLAATFLATIPAQVQEEVRLGL